MVERLITALQGAALEIWEDVRGRAALVGTFDPIEMLGEVVPDEVSFQVLDALGDQCEEVEIGGHVRWRLRPDARREVLAELSGDGRLRAVAEAAQAISTDQFGEYLLGGVLGTLDRPEKSGTDLGQLHAAVQFVEPHTDAAPAPREVETLMRREEVLEAIEFLLPIDLIGRDEQLARIEKFIRDGAPDPDKIIVITGVGGSGKSAMLAAFVKRQHRPDWSGSPTIWLDFDRPLLSAADPVALTLELSRQLALFRPALAERLSAFRADIRNLIAHEGSSVARMEDLQSVMWSYWNGAMGAAPIHEPIALVLDTFEEVLLQGDRQRDVVERWIRSLIHEGGLKGVRPIFAGREFPESWLKANGHRLYDHIRLDDLDPPAAAHLLQLLLDRHGAKGAFPRAALVERFGGNPLMLGILARFLAAEGRTAADELVAGKDSNKLRGEFAQSFLYTRILNRIRSDDPDLAKLAYPGLALRRVTPKLIERVIAGPCALGKIDGARARDLFGKLSTQIWLVRPDSQTSAVVHRRELRRLMLASLPADKNAAFTMIHRNAMDYYAGNEDDELSSDDQYHESVYHSCLSGKPSLPPDLAGIDRFVRAIGEDLQDLPIEVRAKLKRDSDRALTDAEVQALAAPERTAYQHEKARESISAGYAESSGDKGGGDDDGPLDPETETADAFAKADFDRVEACEKALVEGFVAQISGETMWTLKSDPDVSDLGIWRAAMVALARRSGGRLATRLRTRMDTRKGRIGWDRPFFPISKTSMLTIGQVTGALLALLDAPLPDGLVHSFGIVKPMQTIDRLDKLRVARLLRDWKGVRLDGRLRISMDLIAMLDSQVMKGASAMLQSLPEHARRLLVDPSHPMTGDPAVNLALIGSVAHEFVHVDPGTFITAPMARGVTRELHLPIQAMLHEVSAKRLVAFAAHAAATRLEWPIETQPEALAERLAHDSKRWVATLVEIADRAGLLIDLIDRTADGHRQPARHAQLRTLIAAYDKRLRRIGKPTP